MEHGLFKAKSAVGLVKIVLVVGSHLLVSCLVSVWVWPRGNV